MLDTPTKAMVFGAAAATMLAAGIYIAKEYRSYSAASEVAAARAAARKELFRLAEASDGEEYKVKTLCVGAESLSKGNGDSAALAKNVTRNCRALGYL